MVCMEDLVPLTFKVTFSATSPDIMEIFLPDEIMNPLLFCWRLNGDAVHAELSAVVSCPFPVPLGVLTNC